MGATTFTRGPGDFVRPYFLTGPHRPGIRSFFEGASQSFVPGEPLIASTDSHQGNCVKVASNDPTSNLIGIAVHGATGTQVSPIGANTGGWGSRTDSTVLASGAASSLGMGIAGSLGAGVGPSYQPTGTGSTTALKGNGATVGVVQVYTLDVNTLFVACALNGQAISNNDIGSKFGFEKDTNYNIWRIDNGDTSNTVVQIVGLFDADGDVNGKYIFKFVAATNLLFGER